MTTWHNEAGDEVVPVHRFPAHFHPRKKGHFVQVFLWRYVHEMRSTFPRGAPAKQRNRTCAYLNYLNPAVPMERLKPDRLGRPVYNRSVGELHFCLRYITRAQVAHEAFHAILQLQRWKRIQLANTFEETQARKAINAEEYLAESLEAFTRNLNRELAPWLEGTF